MQYRVHIDMDQDLATLYWNIAGQPEQEICSWQWSLDSFGENTRLDASKIMRNFGVPKW